MYISFKFPYYIVRFKLSRRTLPRILFQQGFHTTQYDLNLPRTTNIQHFLLQFPYYIVRFKQGITYTVMENGKRFHTTQYDLNRKNIITDDEKKESFHTTQYDLNFIVILFYFYRVFQFPYYIVRFKQQDIIRYIVEAHGFHTTQYDLNFSEISRERLNDIGFHTTQYDLNELFTLTSLTAQLFPYYIVRFKRNMSTPLASKYFRFHTTQYDLNCERNIRRNRKEKVSILHSTI